MGEVASLMKPLRSNAVQVKFLEGGIVGGGTHAREVVGG